MKNRLSPLRIVIVVSTTVLGTELLLMGLLHEFLMAHFKLPDEVWNLIDAITLTAILSLALYFLVFRKMREYELRFQKISAAAQDAITIIDGQGRITDWNRAAQRMFQYSRKEALGQALHRLIAPPRYHAEAARGFALFQETGSGPVIGKTIELAAQRKNGDEFPIELSLSALRIDDCWHAIGIIRDIGERKQIADSLWQSRSLLQSIVEHVPLRVFWKDRDSRYLGCNTPFAQDAGCANPDELMGKTDFELAWKDRAELYHADDKAVIASGKPKLDYEEPTRTTPDGNTIWVRTSKVPLHDSDNQIIGVLGIYEDITERKQIDQETQEASIRLKTALEDAIGAIAATLEQRDPYTAGHQRRVAELATAIAGEMGLAPALIEGIRFGGLVHDIGKISVPAEILGKPGRLTDIEFSLIKTHAEAGYDIVKDIAFPWPVADMVHQHHERLDGSGYPQGLKGDQIRLEARILAVADVLEAMSANRPYRPGFGMDAALNEILRCRSTQLDADAVDACLRVINEQRFVFSKE